MEGRGVTAIIFDLDGTLVDSAPDIQAAANRMLKAERCKPLDLATITSFIGNGLPKLVERVMAARDLDPARHGYLTARVSGFYATASSELTALYPGVRAALEHLHGEGHALGLCTNKPEEPARAILADFGLAHLFDAVIGGDTLEVKKPDAAPLHAAAEALGEARVIYVGDSEVDAATAKAAAVPFVLFTEGYRKSPITEIRHDVAFADFANLPALIAGLVAGGAAA